MDYVAFIICVATAMVAVTVVYLATRWIDYAFTKRDDARRCKLVKSCIQTYQSGNKQMAMQLTTGINDMIDQWAKKLEEL